MIQWLANSSCNGWLWDLLLPLSQKGKTDRQQKITLPFNPCHQGEIRIQELGGVSGRTKSCTRSQGAPGFQAPKADVIEQPEMELGLQQIGSLSPSAKVAPAFPQHTGARSALALAQIHQQIHVNLEDERMKPCTCWNSLYFRYMLSQTWL